MENGEHKTYNRCKTILGTHHQPCAILVMTTHFDSVGFSHFLNSASCLHLITWWTSICHEETFSLFENSYPVPGGSVSPAAYHLWLWASYQQVTCKQSRWDLANSFSHTVSMQISKQQQRTVKCRNFKLALVRLFGFATANHPFCTGDRHDAYFAVSVATLTKQTEVDLLQPTRLYTLI